MNNVKINAASTRGVRKEYRHLEVDVWKWVLAEGGRTGKLPTKTTIQQYALEIYRAAGHTDFKVRIYFLQNTILCS